jgi:aminoglycoside phosphotransferase (APT) family kinase protein
MERIKGIIIRRDLPAALRMTADQTTRLFESVLDVQHELHAIDFRKIGLSDFGKPEGYVERQVLGWNKRYRGARTPDAPDGEAVMDWLAENMPADTDRPGIIHNDYKFDNVVLDPGNPFKIIGVLDWEMATVGDPLMDLGCTLGYWIEPGDPEEMQMMRMMPTDAKGALTRAEIVHRYAALSGRTMDNFSFYHCFGMFRLAVIAQQIYYRYFHKQTKDDRFKSFILGVHVLINAAIRIVASGGQK